MKPVNLSCAILWSAAMGLGLVVPASAQNTTVVRTISGGLVRELTINHQGQNLNRDSDGDGLSDILEAQLGTNPGNPDSDGDGLRDGEEVTLGTNPLVPDLDTVPGLVSGRRLHLKADTGVTLDATGNVSTWADQSGLGNSAGQATAAAQPLLVSNAVNGQPVVRFDGINDFLNLAAATMGGATQGEVLLVLKTAAIPLGQHSGLWTLGAGGDSYYPLTDGTIYESFGSTTNQLGSTTVQALDQYHLYNVRAQSGAWRNVINGTPYVVKGANTVGFNTGNPLLGRGGAFFKGDIAEIIIYDHVLTASEREAVGRYLNLRYVFIASAPAAPTALTAGAMSGTQVSLSWQATLTPAATTFTIERKTGAGAYAVVAEVDNTLSYLDATATAGITYAYRVKARNLAGATGYSNEATATALWSGTPALPLGGLRLWLKADTLVPGAPVPVWRDQSGLANDAFQPGVPAQPLVVAGALNGQPVVRFDGNNDHVFLPNFMVGAVRGEAFVVLKSTPSPSVHRGLWFMGGGDTFYPVSSGAIQESFGSTVAYTGTLPAQPLDQYHLYNIGAQSGQWASRHNGAPYLTQAANVVGFPAGPLLGRSSGSFLTGDVAEIMIYDHVLTETERETVADYLNRKYAFTVPAAFDRFRDLNGDGLADEVDRQLGINPGTMDVDGDGVANPAELLQGTDPFRADTDGDGVSDGTDAFPLDPTRWNPGAGTPGDTTPPVITLTKPANAVLQP